MAGVDTGGETHAGVRREWDRSRYAAWGLPCSAPRPRPPPPGPCFMEMAQNAALARVPRGPCATAPPSGARARERGHRTRSWQSTEQLRPRSSWQKGNFAFISFVRIGTRQERPAPGTLLARGGPGARPAPSPTSAEPGSPPCRPPTRQPSSRRSLSPEHATHLQASGTPRETHLERRLAPGVRLQLRSTAASRARAAASAVSAPPASRPPLCPSSRPPGTDSTVQITGEGAQGR